MGAQGDATETLFAMPAPFSLSKRTISGETVVSFGPRVMFVFDDDDLAMRNLAIVALRRAGVSGMEVAQLFGLRHEYVSRLCKRAREEGSAGLVGERGRPRSLDAAGVSRAHARSDAGRSGAEIARELGVSEATISRLLARRSRVSLEQLALVEQPGVVDGETKLEEVADAARCDGPAETPSAEPSENAESIAGEDEQGDEEATSSHARLEVIEEGTRESRYAGAMLLHGFLDRAGASTVLAALSGPRARAYGAASVVLAATFGFALGSSSAEGTKHLLTGDAGAVIGLARFPHLRTLRPRLSGLADGIDPLALQCALAKAMLDADEEAVEVFFVDDHFVAYAGAAPVQKGWNTRRRHAEPGRDDTVIVDEAWRAICFSSGAPSGLSQTMLAPLDQLRSIISERKVMIGFDRGGAYPKVFAELTRRGFDFVTYRRAPLKAPGVQARRTWTLVEGRRRYMSVADETVAMEGVGEVRQISVYEGERMVLQILTSDKDSSAALLARRLVNRWRIENTFKYLEDHHGIHWLCDYEMDLRADTRAVANPARVAARAELKAKESAVATLERSIGTTATSPADDIAETNRELRRLQDELVTARKERDEAEEALRPIPAKVARDELDPTARVASPRLHRRALQMVCRLLAYNAELDLARSLNAYLDDEDEYRAITRNLLHQPGTVTYAKSAITVTLRPPDAPRVARALGLLCDQLNASPPRMTGDRRPITYEIAAES